MAVELKSLSTPEQIAGAGERAYQEHRARLERDAPGQFAVIDVLSGEVFVAEFPERAMAAAKQAKPTGVFHMVRVGSTGAYRVSHLLHGDRRSRPV